MNMLLVYMWALVTNPLPLGEEEKLLVPEEFRPLVRGVALQLEIWDKKEMESSKWQTGITGDVRFLRHWYNLVKDCPPLYERHRWHINYETCCMAVCFNHEYSCWIEGQLNGYIGATEERREWLKVVKAESILLCELWRALCNLSVNQQYCLVTKRMALKTLRDNLSEEEYELGIVPPFVPIWRFNEIR